MNTTEQGCFNCSAGKYAPVALNDYCIECGAGAATGQDETASSCDSCSPGTYAVGNGEVNVCLDCPAGTYSESRASICTDCEVGTYAAVNRSSTCIDCDAGKSTLSQTNALHCVDCSVGQYSNGRASTCSLCPVGHYADKSGTAQCIGCEAGSYSNATGVSQCEYCLNGTYQETSSQSSCVSCEVGKHAPYLNSKYCFKCADGHTSVQGAAQCEQCDPGYFWAYSKGANRWACESCPFGATCGGGKDQPVAQQGFWIDRLAASRDPSLVRNVYPCARDTCSKLSVSSRRRMASSNCLLLSNFSSPSCADDALFCAAGSKGPLCGSCEEGWNFNAESRVCAPCGETTTWTQAFASLAICLVVFAFLYSLRNGTLFIPKPMRWLTKGRTKIKIKFINVLLHINRAALKLMVSTYQIVMSAGSNLELTFPEPYTTFSMWMGFVQLNFFSLDCLKSTYYISVYTTCAFPIIFVGLNWVVFFIRRAIYLVTRNDDNDDEEEEDKAAIISETNANNNNDNEDDGEDDDDEYLISLRNQHINISLMVVFVVLPPVAKKQFRALDCVVLEDGSSYLRDDTGIDCLSDGYRRFSLINGCLIAIYQSIPLAYIFLLCRVRHKLSPLIGENESTQEALARRDTDKDLDAIRFLFNDTKIDRWYFEVLELYRRIIFTAVLPLLSKDSAIIAYIGCLMGLVSVIYFRELLPFRTDFTNLIAVVCQYVILIVFLCALMIETNSRELFKFTDFSFGLFLIGINVIILVLVVYGGLLRYRDAQHIAQSIKELEIESAVDFTSEEFADAISSLQLTVPKTHILAYYYTSLKEAEAIMLDKGIPAIKLHDALTTHTTHRPPLIITEELDENKTTPNQEESVLIGDRGGVVLSLKAPHELAAGDPAFNFMNSHATSREAVFCLSLPRSLLWCVQGKETEENKKKKQTRRQSPLIKGTSLDGLPVTPQNESHTKHLRLLPVEILEALGNPAVVHHHHHHHHHGGHRGASHAPQRRGHSPQHSVKTAQRHPSSIPQFGTQKSAIELKRSEVEMFKLNTRLVLSAYQLKGFDDIDETLKFDSIELQDCLCIKPKPIINGLINMTRAIKLHRCSYSEEYTALLKAARSACDKLRLVPVYCYTSTTVFENLAARGVRLSGMSQSESGVYFTLLSPCALGFGTDSFEVTLLEHLYGSAAVSYFEHKGLADVVLVYGAEPYCIEGYKSSNRVRFGLDHFREFRSVNDHFHLRKDRIITAIQLADTAHQHHKDVEEFDFEMADINREIQLDAQYHTILNQVELEAKHNIMVNNPNNTNFDLEVMSDEYEEKSLGDKWLFKSASTTDFIDKKPHHGRSSHDNMSVSFEMV